MKSWCIITVMVTCSAFLHNKAIQAHSLKLKYTSCTGFKLFLKYSMQTSTNVHFLQQTLISSFIGFWGPLPSSTAPTAYPWDYVLSQPLFSPCSCPSRLGNLGGKWSSPTTDCGREEVLLVALMISRVAGGPLSLSYLIVRRFRVCVGLRQARVGQDSSSSRPLTLVGP